MLYSNAGPPAGEYAFDAPQSNGLLGRERRLGVGQGACSWRAARCPWLARMRVALRAGPLAGLLWASEHVPSWPCRRAWQLGCWPACGCRIRLAAASVLVPECPQQGLLGACIGQKCEHVPGGGVLLRASASWRVLPVCRAQKIV